MKKKTKLAIMALLTYLIFEEPKFMSKIGRIGIQAFTEAKSVSELPKFDINRSAPIVFDEKKEKDGVKGLPV